MQLPDIRSLVPHAGKMMLLDRAIAATEESFCAEVTVRPDSFFCGEQGVGAWVGIEYMAQTIAAYAGYVARLRGESVKVGFLLGSRYYDCGCDFFAPLSVLQIHARCVLQSNNGLGSFECTIDDQRSRLATATITVFQPADLSKFLEENIV